MFSYVSGHVSGSAKMKKEKSFGKEVLIGTLATVLGGIVLALIPTKPDSFLGKLSAFLNESAASVWKFLKSPSNISIGFLLLLLCFTILAIGFQFRVLLLLKRKNLIKSPDRLMLHHYREDIFFGVIWRWDRIPPTSNGLNAFCPVCGTRLVCNPFFQHTKHGSVFFCETCNKDVATLDGDLQNTLRAVWRQVERKINSGEWKKVVEVQRNAHRQSV
jgi:hypothetical protein